MEARLAKRDNAARNRRRRGARRLGDWQAAVEDWNAAVDAYERVGDADGVAAVAMRIVLRLSASGRVAALQMAARA